MSFLLVQRSVLHSIRIPSRNLMVTPIAIVSSSSNEIRRPISSDRKKLPGSWIRIGEYYPHLLKHLTTFQIIRAFLVLRLCSSNFIVDNSLKLFNLSKKFGIFGTWIVRKTFFDQFVGGDNLQRMSQVVLGMQKRNLQLMVAPVLEEDVNDKKSLKTKYDDNMNSFLKLADMTASLENNRPILQLKISALIPPAVLEEVSIVISRNLTNGKNEKEEHAKIIESVCNSIENQNALKLQLTDEYTNYFFDGLIRAEEIAKRARSLNLYILVDAEFWSCRLAISLIAQVLMSRHNRGNDGLFGNTIQAYLKGAPERVEDEFDIITRLLGANWFGKIVRGAYLDQERDLALQRRYSDPTCSNYTETNSSYDKAVIKILHRLPQSSSHLVVATHNEWSIRSAADCMKNLSLTNQHVSFAQIYGMADYLSGPLVDAGYSVYKSTPYGNLESAMPYLSRRASENKSVLSGAREERKMLSNELSARLLKK